MGQVNERDVRREIWVCQDRNEKKRSRLKKKGGGTPSRKDKAPDTENSEHAELKHRNQFGLMGTCYFIPLLREVDCAFKSTTRSVLKIWFTKVALEEHWRHWAGCEDTRGIKNPRAKRRVQSSENWMV